MSHELQTAGRAGVVPALDGLRGLAVMLVLAYHFGLLRFGWLGVGLFFTLSGFLITRLLLETKQLSLGNYLGRFYWRRILRIFPLYFGFVLAVMAVYLLTGKPSGAGVQFPWLATFTFNIYMGLEEQAGLQRIFKVLWSISTEEQYYLLWPLVVWLLPRRVLGWVAVGMILAAPMIRYLEADAVRSLGIDVFSDGKLVYYFPFGQVDAFALGACMALFERLIVGRRALWLGLVMLLPAFVVMIRQAIVSILPGGPPYPTHMGFPFSAVREGFHVWGYSAGYLFFAGVMLLALAGSGRMLLRRTLEWGPARLVGRISYGMYVFHWPILLVFEEVSPLSDMLLLRLLQWKLFLAIVLAFSYLSHRYFESWFLRQKERFFA